MSVFEPLVWQSPGKAVELQAQSTGRDRRLTNPTRAGYSVAPRLGECFGKLIMLSSEAALAAREDLKKYGNNARLLFALETKFRLPDIHTVATDALTDGPNDKKCDLVFVDREAGYVVVAQAYEGAPGDPSKRVEAKSTKASDLNTAVSWLLTGRLDSLPEALRSAALEVREALKARDVRAFQVWFVHNRDGSQNVASELQIVEKTLDSTLRRSFAESEVDEISAHEVDRATLDDWYRALEAPILVTEVLDVEIPGVYEMHGDNWKAAVTSVPAGWLHKLWQSHGSSLFSANVRDYLGSRRSTRNVNNNIKETATESPERFWVYNNGITALVNEYAISASGDDRLRLQLQGLSIVNGAQTTGALGSLRDAPSETAHVQIRFVRCDNLDTVQRIVRYNNTQNVVKVTDFRSNDAIQRRLREEFTCIPDVTYLGGRRGGEEDVIRRPGNLIATDTCAQSLACFHGDPGVAYNRKSEILESDKLYSKYFCDELTAEHIVLTFSLLRAVEEKKRELTQKGSLTRAEELQLKLLRNRGATFMLAAAIASCLETFLGEVVPNYFRCSFGAVSPVRGMDLWVPVVNACVPFCSKLEKPVSGGLKNQSDVEAAIDSFREMVEATKGANADIFRSLAAHVCMR